jgi:hypothetical protein
LDHKLGSLFTLHAIDRSLPLSTVEIEVTIRTDDNHLLSIQFVGCSPHTQLNATSTRCFTLSNDHKNAQIATLGSKVDQMDAKPLMGLLDECQDEVYLLGRIRGG